MSASPRNRIALLPLDERPVNRLLPLDVARVGAVGVATPPTGILPDYRSPGDTTALAEWLRDTAMDPEISQLIVSLDMLCFGGLIASRTSADTTREALKRLDLLRLIREARPGLKMSAISVVMRASDSYSDVEEPSYWSQYGKELHRLGGDIQRFEANQAHQPSAPLPSVPDEVVSDFVRRRIRNHIVNLSALALVDDETLDFLAMTADDTAEFSAGSAEQNWLRHWMHFLPGSDRVLMYPGADEVGAVLVARSLSESAETPARIRVVCPEPGGIDLVPPFENVPLSESISRQITAAGAREQCEDSDVVLVVHAPDPARHDMYGGGPPGENSAAVERTVRAVRESLDSGQPVALADVRYSNGCDPVLVTELVEAGLLERLTSFGGWNTAGNTLGSVIAVAVAATIADACGTLDRLGLQQALLTRVVDDFAYQSIVRPRVMTELFVDHYPVSDDVQRQRAEREIQSRLSHILTTELPFEGWSITSLSLPWRRSFEVCLGLESSPLTSVD